MLKRAICLPLVLAGAFSLAQGPVNPLLDGGVEWREIGPANMGGRVVRLQIDNDRQDTWYVGTASGGLWKTTNGGDTFEGLFQYEDVNSIGDVAVSKSDPNLVWIGSGEHNPRNSNVYGRGVYKSTDGGKTWAKKGLEKTRHIGRMAIHPTDPDTVYVGAMGRTWGRNEERGLYKTTDGGDSWEKILYVDDQTGVIEVQMHPTDPDTLLVATYQRQRQIYDDGEPVISHGPGSGVWRTEDGGKTWDRLGADNGFIDGELGRTGISFCEGTPNVAYLITGAQRLGREQQGVWRSDDSGKTWTKVNGIAPRPMYYSQIRVAPSDPDLVYVLGTRMVRSTNGGKDFEQLPMRGVHVDHHAMWIDPDDPEHVVLGNDGGVYETFNGFEQTIHHRKMALGQFYHIGVSNQFPYMVGGGLQDNGSWMGPGFKRGSEGPDVTDFRRVGGGDGFLVKFDPNDPRIIYFESQNGNIRRAFLGPRDDAPEGRVRRPAAPNEGERQRWAWKTDFVLDPSNSATYYVAGQYLYKSTERGANLKVISPKLPLTELGTGTAVSVSPVDPKIIWVGTDDGAVWLTKDGGENWEAIHEKIGVPVKCYVSTIEASRYDADRAYICFDGHRSNDERPFVYSTDDLGDTWQDLNATLPSFGSTRTLREDTQNSDLLFCGTEFFAYCSLDRGKTWLAMNGNLPTVSIHEFAIADKAGELVAGTHGRSIWAMDISWLREMHPDMQEIDAFLFGSNPAVLWNEPEADESEPDENATFQGENPPAGAMIRYWLGEDVGGVVIEVTDMDDKVISTMRGPGGKGINAVNWNLMSGGGKVAPGYYRVVMRAGDHTRRRILTVMDDPSS